ncbi:hypothetical protein [Kordiimonas sp. SCSIO 12610]|uniref:hypothetical protein n=1 Tax=Kordiimonas sp. SCSIO 12610 TaxID=2829597 RepID=UPI00210C2A15|nr:hypothetical protein [Kordiimonas sp. SCSIO 12610]UTW54725.1 hypothetical protein KFF44_13065 [Kordiimonas sp. SCSIO 12610]
MGQEATKQTTMIGREPYSRAVSNATREKVTSLLTSAISQGVIGSSCDLIGFLDIDGVKATVNSLKSAFPGHFTHLFAAKSNTMLSTLKLVRECGMGCEVASASELEQAIRAGFTAGEISFDEPAKTKSTLQRIIDLGVGLHIDNFDEYEIVADIASKTAPTGPAGFRLNPQRGGGAIASTSTATPTSKFGVGMRDAGNRERLIELYRTVPWLNRLHVHVGAQGCSFELMAASIRDVIDLADEINDGLPEQKVTAIDIGGGLPVNFMSDEISPTFKEYADFLRPHLPELFSGKYKIFTEFGRSILAKNGLLASKTEYVKQMGGKNIAIGHAGAQIAARTVFGPVDWALRFSVYDQNGKAKAGSMKEYDLAGPCCFSGDLIARDIELPEIEAHDWLVAHDTGAYYFAIPYFFNALPVPAIYGYSFDGGENGTPVFEEYRKEQSIDQVLALIG